MIRSLCNVFGMRENVVHFNGFLPSIKRFSYHDIKCIYLVSESNYLRLCIKN